MKDLGFGVIDQRTVIIFFVIIALAQLLTGFQIPVDVQNAKNLFIDIVLLTGYLYFARTIYRFPFTFLYSILITLSGVGKLFTEMLVNKGLVTINDFVFGFLSFLDLEHTLNPQPEITLPDIGGFSSHTQDKENFVLLEKLFSVLSWIAFVIFAPILIPLNSLILALTFGAWTQNKKIALSPFTTSPLLGVLDRFGLIVIAIFAVLPQFKSYVVVFGICGLFLIVLIYVIRGNFTAVIEDNIEKEEKDKNGNKTGESSYSNPMYVEIVNSENRPISIKSSFGDPIYVENANQIDPIPVNIQDVTFNKGILPVHTQNMMYPIPVSVNNINPIAVTVENDISIENNSPLPVEVTNIVKTKNGDDDTSV